MATLQDLPSVMFNVLVNYCFVSDNRLKMEGNYSGIICYFWISELELLVLVVLAITGLM